MAVLVRSSILFIAAFIFHAVVSSSYAYAELGFDSLSKSEVEGALEDFTALMEHTTASPASSLGDIFGFELGLVGGIATTPTIERVVRRGDNPSDAESSLPHLGFIGMVSIPFGVTFETKIFPHTYDKATGVTLKSQSLAVKWTISKLIPMPLDVAIRAQFTNSDIKVENEVQNQSTQNQSVDTTIEIGSVSSAFIGMASYKLLIVEPFVGFGVINQDGEIKVKGDPEASIFDTQSQKANASTTGIISLLGVQVNLLVFKAAVEYSRIFDSNKFTAKLAFGF